MEKKVAVVVRDRQEEALRMALGLLMLKDDVEVYVLDGKLEESEKNRTQLKTAAETDMKLFTNCRENAYMEQLSVEEIAVRLTTYDTVLAY
ncbi:MAG: hypothetical protein GY866_14550 [Proteobacteria bacterium]|nr:hypothetical protein [Pseudomonadota bacterium]